MNRGIDMAEKEKMNAVNEVNELVENALIALDDFASFDQEKIDYIVAKFQNKSSNPNGAQIIFTTHNTKLMNETLIRKDQIYFVDKSQSDGSSELYTISEFSTKTTDNIRKGYLLGKYGAIPNIEIEGVE